MITDLCFGVNILDICGCPTIYTLRKLLFFEPLDLINQMDDAVYIERISSTTQLPRFRFDGDNRLDFLGGFPDIAAHFGFSRLLYDDAL